MQKKTIKEDVEKWQSIAVSIYCLDSKKEIKNFIKQKLPTLCNVDLIEWTRACRQKSFGNIYAFFCKNLQHPQNFIFYKKTAFLPKQKGLLKKIALALEKNLLHLERHQELKKQKEQWELAFDTITTAICLTDLRGQILKTNKTFRQKIGKTKKELNQKNYFKAFFGRDFKEENPLCVERENEFFEILLQKIPQNGAEDIQLAVLKNITKEINIQKKTAKSAGSKELSIVSNSIAHELNNPIGGIVSLLQMMTAKHTRGPRAEDLQEMLKAGQRCLQIINKILKTAPKTSLKSVSPPNEILKRQPL